MQALDNLLLSNDLLSCKNNKSAKLRYMKKESKSWQRFEGKIRNLKQYLQLMDLSLKNSNTQCNTKKGTGIISEALGASAGSHRQLNVPNNQRDITRTFISARKQMNEQAFVELHCIFSDYIAHVIAEIASNEPKKLLSILGNDTERSISFAEIVSLGNYDAVIQEMALRVFRILENLRSTKDMMQKLCKIAKISVDNDLLNRALIYIDVRHIIIHRDSVVDNVFKSKDGSGLIPQKNDKLQLKYAVTNKAINTVYELCRTLDNALIAKEILKIRKQL